MVVVREYKNAKVGYPIPRWSDYPDDVDEVNVVGSNAYLMWEDEEGKANETDN